MWSINFLVGQPFKRRFILKTLNKETTVRVSRAGGPGSAVAPAGECLNDVKLAH